MVQNLLFIILHAIFSFAVDVQLVRPELLTYLEQSFSQSEVPLTADLNNSRWDCMLYGARSQMQVKKTEKFYSFSKKSGQPLHLKNSGRQKIDIYGWDKAGWLGQNQNIFEAIRMDKGGNLIAEISTPNVAIEGARSDKKSKIDKERTILVFSFCRNSLSKKI